MENDTQMMREGRDGRVMNVRDKVSPFTTEMPHRSHRCTDHHLDIPKAPLFLKILGAQRSVCRQSRHACSSGDHFSSTLELPSPLQSIFSLGAQLHDSEHQLSGTTPKAASLAAKPFTPSCRCRPPVRQCRPLDPEEQPQSSRAPWHPT